MFCSWARVPRVLGPLDVEEDVEVEVEVEVAVEEEDDDDGFALRPRLFLVFAVFFFFLLEGMVFSRFCLAASLLSMCSRGEFTGVIRACCGTPTGMLVPSNSERSERFSFSRTVLSATR